MSDRLKADRSKPHRCPDCWSIYDEYRDYDASSVLHLRNLKCPKCGKERQRAVYFYIWWVFWKQPAQRVQNLAFKYDMKLFRKVMPRVGYHSKRHFIKEPTND